MYALAYTNYNIDDSFLYNASSRTIIVQIHAVLKVLAFSGKVEIFLFLELRTQAFAYLINMSCCLQVTEERKQESSTLPHVTA